MNPTKIFQEKMTEEVRAQFSLGLFMASFLLLTFSLIILLPLLNAVNITRHPHAPYLITNTEMLWLSTLYAMLSLLLLFFEKVGKNPHHLKRCCLFALRATFVSLLAVMNCDFLWLFEKLKHSPHATAFGNLITLYFFQEKFFYSELLVFASILLGILFYSTHSKKSVVKPKVPFFLLMTLLALPVTLLWPLPLFNVMLFIQSDASHFVDFPRSVLLVMNTLYCLLALGLLTMGNRMKKQKRMTQAWHLQCVTGSGIMTGLSFCLQLALILIACHTEAIRSGNTLMFCLLLNLGATGVKLIPLLILFCSTAFYRHWLKQKRFNTETLSKKPVATMERQPGQQKKI